VNVGTLVGILAVEDRMDEGIRRALNDAERRFGAGGDAAGDRFVRGADGKVRDRLTGQFAQAGDLAGTEFAREAGSAMESELDSGGTSGVASWLGGLGGKVAGGTALAGGIIGAGLVAGVMSAMDDQAGDDLLAGRLGLDGEAAAAAGRAAGEIYTNNFGDSMDDARGAVDAVWSTLGDSIGDSDDALVRAGERAITLAQIMEVDVSTAVNTVGAAVRTGLAKDATEGFDLMTAAAQQMPTEMRAELIPAVDEYGTFLATMGFTGAEAFGLLASASRDGMYGIDKTGDAIKELSIRATDMSAASVAAYEAAGLSAEDMSARFLAGGEEARGALDDLVEGLLGIEDPVARSNAAIGLFGTPLEDLNVTEIPDFLASLSTAGTGMEDFAGSTDAAASTIGDNAASKLETFKRKGLMAITDFLGGEVLPGIEGFLDRAGPIFDELLAAWDTDGFSGVADQLGAIWDEAWPVMQAKAAALFERARTWLVENGPKALRAGGEMAERFWDWLQDAWPPFARRMAGLYGQVATWFTETGIPAVGEWLREAGPRLWQWIQDAYPSFVKTMGGLFAEIGVWFVTTAIPWMATKGAELWSALAEWLYTDAGPALVSGLGSLIAAAIGWLTGTAIPWLRERGSELWGWLVRTAQEQGPKVLEWLRGLPGQVGGFLTGTAAPALRRAAVEWFGRLKDAAEDKGAELVGWMRGLPGRAVGALGNIASALYGVGRDLIEGLLNGIRAMAGRIVDAVTGPIGDAVDGAKRLLGVSSPSRVFAMIGRHTVAGLVEGLERDRLAPVVPIRRMAADMMRAYDADLTGRLPGAPAGGTWWAPSSSQIDGRGAGADTGPISLRIDKLITQLPDGRVLAEAVDVTVLAQRADRDRRGRSPYTARSIAGAA